MGRSAKKRIAGAILSRRCTRLAAWQGALRVAWRETARVAGRLDRSLLGWTMASYCDERLSLHRAWPVIGFEGFPMEPKSTAVALAIAARPTRGTVRAAKRGIRSAGHALCVKCEA
jgi:hypothetical protein